jgi:hypothetical protein
MLFNYLLGLDGKNVDAVTKRLRDSWGQGLRTVDATEFGDLRSEISNLAGDTETGNRWVGIATAVATGKYASLVELLMEQNKIVMEGRGGAPWIEERQGRLHVRFRDEHGTLPTREETSAVWRFPYFLNSLQIVAATVKEN